MDQVKKLRMAAALGGTLLVGACASMSASECATADWNAVGYEDGVQGRASDYVARHRKACASHGVTPNFIAYSEGRLDGLKEYCREPNGVHVGVRGGAYKNVCPDESHGVFMAAYQAGRQLYEYNLKVKAHETQIRAHYSDLEDLEHEIEQTQWEIVEGDMTDLARMKLVIRVVELSKEQDDLKQEIEHLKTDLAHLIEKRDHYRVDLHDQYGLHS